MNIMQQHVAAIIHFMQEQILKLVIHQTHKFADGSLIWLQKLAKSHLKPHFQSSNKFEIVAA